MSDLRFGLAGQQTRFQCLYYRAQSPGSDFAVAADPKLKLELVDFRIRYQFPGSELEDLKPVVLTAVSHASNKDAGLTT